MSITLSIPPVIVQEVRDYARQTGTSLNKIIRDYLENIAMTVRKERENQSKKAFDLLMSQDDGGLSENWKFDRDDANSR